MALKAISVPIALAGAVSLVVLTVACGGGGDEGEPNTPTSTSTESSSPLRTLHGRLVLPQLHGAPQGRVCQGTGSYSDIRGGAGVVVKDGTGAIIATSTLDVGRTELIKDTPSVRCVFTFSVPGMPKRDSYTIEVSQRGENAFSYDQLESQDWQVELPLGG
jgi:hypothetical protein